MRIRNIFAVLCGWTNGRDGYVQESRYVFTWDWYDAFYTSIRMHYGGGDYSYMDNMQMYDGRLDCMLDGYPVTFFGY